MRKASNLPSIIISFVVNFIHMWIMYIIYLIINCFSQDRSLGKAIISHSMSKIIFNHPLLYFLWYDAYTCHNAIENGTPWFINVVTHVVFTTRNVIYAMQKGWKMCILLYYYLATIKTNFVKIFVFI